MFNRLHACACDYKQACDTFMGDMLKGLATRLQSAQEQGSLSTKAILIALLGRPNVNCGDPAYLTDLSPLMKCDTNNPSDMVRIVRHAREHYDGRTPLILRMTGDGQSIITLSWLKRRWPDMYKHVLITNGQWHSHGHFMLQAVKLFWSCFYCTCAKHLHIWMPAAERSSKSMPRIDPTINNLEKNAYLHYTSFIFSVHVASVVFIVNHVTEPPPELFLSNPVHICSWPLTVSYF